MIIINRIIYTFSLLNIVICLAVAPFELFYITLILKWQEDCSVTMLLTCIWCSVSFTLIAILNFYIAYNKNRQHWSGLKKNMRFLVVCMFVLFGQILMLMLLKYRLPLRAKHSFTTAMNDYYSHSVSSVEYIDATQKSGKCCGYDSLFDWELVKHTLPSSCCAASTSACFPQMAYKTGCSAFFSHLISFGTGLPMMTNVILLLTALPVYIIIMTYIQFSHIVEYEELQSSNFIDTGSVGEGTHQSWGNSRRSINNSSVGEENRKCWRNVDDSANIQQIVV